MRIDVHTYTNRFADNKLHSCTAIVIDVLRATTSIIRAAQNGALKIIPTKEPGDAASVAMNIGARDCVLAGERGGIRLPGFDIGNSPLDFSPEAVSEKNVIFCTTNGTQAICGMSGAANLLIGAMINRTAVARRAVELGQDIVIMCAGTDGRFSADDICAAGAIIDAIYSFVGRIPTDDCGIVSHLLYCDWLENRIDLDSTLHCSRLIRLGFGDDIKFCFTPDVTDVVPFLKDGVITV